MIWGGKHPQFKNNFCSNFQWHEPCQTSKPQQERRWWPAVSTGTMTRPSHLISIHQKWRLPVKKYIILLAVTYCVVQFSGRRPQWGFVTANWQYLLNNVPYFEPQIPPAAPIPTISIFPGQSGINHHTLNFVVFISGKIMLSSVQSSSTESGRIQIVIYNIPVSVWYVSS